MAGGAVCTNSKAYQTVHLKENVVHAWQHFIAKIEDRTAKIEDQIQEMTIFRCMVWVHRVGCCFWT